MPLIVEILKSNINLSDYLREQSEHSDDHLVPSKRLVKPISTAEGS